jgi:predicted RNase H-like nuclease (RuvC/YqgF family)
MTHPDMFIDYKGRLKILNKKLKQFKNNSHDLETVIERQKQEIKTLTEIMLTFKIKFLIKKLREKGKHGLALKIVNKYNLKQVSESYYD